MQRPVGCEEFLLLAGPNLTTEFLTFSPKIRSYGAATMTAPKGKRANEARSRFLWFLIVANEVFKNLHLRFQLLIAGFQFRRFGAQFGDVTAILHLHGGAGRGLVLLVDLLQLGEDELLRNFDQDTALIVSPLLLGIANGQRHGNEHRQTIGRRPATLVKSPLADSMCIAEAFIRREGLLGDGIALELVVVLKLIHEQFNAVLA